MPVEANERYGGKCQQFEGDKQIEQIGPEKDRVQPCPHPQQQSPKDLRRPRFRIWRRRKLGAREQTDAGD